MTYFLNYVNIALKLIDKMEKLTMFDNKRCKLTYYNFVKQSKAKQSKAKLLLYLLNNFKFYILQFFNAFKFLSVRFALQNIFLSFAYASLWERGFVKIATKSAPQNKANILLQSASNLFSEDCFITFAMKIKNNFTILNLVNSFLALIKFNFDN